MRVLAIGSDRGIFDSNSQSAARQGAYANAFGELDIIVFAKKEHRLQSKKIGAHLTVYTTSSGSRFSYIGDAYRLAKTLPKPDVVTAQDPFEAGLVAWLISKRLKVPLHIQVHTDFLSPAFSKLSILNRVRLFIAQFVLRKATRIRVVSERVKKSITEAHRLGVPITVLPIFVDVGKFRNAEPLPEILIGGKDLRKEYKSIVLMVSRMSPEKNIPLAIEAFEKVAPKDACLLIRTESQNTAGSQKQVYVTNQCAPERLYKTADVILVPSKYEGYGLVVAEALAAGKPVIATDVGIAREAGAIVTDEKNFAKKLAEWFAEGPRVGELRDYPYKSFDEYVRAYADDITSCVRA